MTTLLGIDLTDRRVLVVGGGPVAARRTAPLLRNRALVTLVAPEVCEDVAVLLDDDRLEWRPREVRETDLDGVWLVHTCTGSRDADAAVARWAQDRRVWCVDAGDAGRGSARTPALTSSGEVVVGVVSAGAPDPGRTAAVRDALAEVLRTGAVDVRRRRRTAPHAGRVVLVGGGPGAVDLVTLRGRRALAEADVVVADRLGPTDVLAELAADVEVIDVGKTPGHHAVPQHEINRILVERARRKGTLRRGGDQSFTALDDLEIADSTDEHRILEINEVLERFTAIDPLKADLVKLRYFVGLSIPEAATILGISEPTAKRYWAYARAWLLREMRGPS